MNFFFLNSIKSEFTSVLKATMEKFCLGSIYSFPLYNEFQREKRPERLSRQKRRKYISKGDFKCPICLESLKHSIKLNIF